jgi:hypothetical protein
MYPNISELRQDSDLPQHFGYYGSRNEDACDLDYFLWNNAIASDWVREQIDMQRCATDEA